MKNNRICTNTIKPVVFSTGFETVYVAGNLSQPTHTAVVWQRKLTVEHMNCPDCNNDRTRVVDTGPNADGDAVRRRRECQRCSFRFTTYERPEWDSLQVKKRDENIEPYDQQKLRNGITQAVEKRPIADEQVTELLETIETELRARDELIVASSLIGDLVSENLRTLDKVAYIRFVSVYKAFSEPQEFLQELDAVLDAELDDFEALNGSQ